MILRAYFDAPIATFCELAPDQIVGQIARFHSQGITHEQTSAWREQVLLLQAQIDPNLDGHIFFEFTIPRMGLRADVILLIGQAILLLEFKTGAREFLSSDRRQVEGYALDLKNFHAGSHDAPIVPVLIATKANDHPITLLDPGDHVFEVVLSNGMNLNEVIRCVRSRIGGESRNPLEWRDAPYHPTPTIIQAAQALYAEHGVEEIARSDAGAKNLSITSQRLRSIISRSRSDKKKSICFVTGVPGSGKTLVGLDLATSSDELERAVFLSGNEPLVRVLREALARDERDRLQVSKAAASRKVRSFIQNVHHFRDDALSNDAPPHENIVVFDEAQRAWDRTQTTKFMTTKRHLSDFHYSEPEFLLRYMDRHAEWCVVVALIGGGQEIHTGEAGLLEWRNAVGSLFSGWDVYYSDRLEHSDYAGEDVDFGSLPNRVRVAEPALHLATSMRSYRAESLSSMIHNVVAGNAPLAAQQYAAIRDNYPMRLTRDLQTAREWARNQARGSDSIGLIASSGAIRLKPHGVFVKYKPEVENWFLNAPEDVRSSHALEDVVTEFDIQGLELDWAIVGWDADLRYADGIFEHWNFAGARWRRIHDRTQQRYLENAYRVLLTRARQGMVIFLPEGDPDDPTRDPHWYDGTYQFLRNCGIVPI